MGRNYGNKNTHKKFTLEIFNNDTQQWEKDPDIYITLNDISKKLNLSYWVVRNIRRKSQKKICNKYKIGLITDNNE